MKCYVCGFEDSDKHSTDFIEIDVCEPNYFMKSSYSKVSNRHIRVKAEIYACPKCGTLKIPIETERNKEETR